MTLVRLKLEKAAGVPQPYAAWRVDLIGDGGVPAGGLDLGSDAVVVRLVDSGRLDADGIALVELTPVEGLLPEGMVYRAEFRATGSSRQETLIFAGFSGAGPVDATDFIVDLPGALTPAALAVHLADTTGAHAASAISVEPFGTVAATQLQAALEEIATEAGGAHPDLAAHDTLGLATQTELDAVDAAKASLAGGRLARSQAPVAGPLLAATRGNGLVGYLGGLSDGIVTAGTSRVRYQVVRKCGLIVLRFANYYNIGTYDVVGPNSITVKASVENNEHPTGTARAVTFQGKTSHVVEPGGWIDSDPLGTDFLTVGAFFSVRTFVSVTAGERFPRMIKTFLSRVEGHNYAAPGADLTSTYVALSSADGFVYGPVGVYSLAVDPATSGRAVALFGDSIIHGVGDGAGWFGWAARALGATVPWIDIGNGGDRAELPALSVNPVYRLAAMRGCSDVFLAYGTNDPPTRTSAQTIADLTTIINRLANQGLRVHVATIPPVSTSSDSWITVANQTRGANMTEVDQINAAIRAGLPLATSVIEVSDAVSSARDSGKWAVYTVAGTITNGSNVISGLPVGHKLTVGSPVVGGTIPAGQTVTAVTATTATYGPSFNSGATAAVTVTSRLTTDGTHPSGTGHLLMSQAVDAALLAALAA